MGHRAFYTAREDNMVSSKALENLRKYFTDLANQKVADINEYTGTLRDVLFDLITADTYVAGIATKILDGDPVESYEVSFVSVPFLKNEHFWQLRDGREVDIEQNPDILAHAKIIEKVRKVCYDILNRGH